MKILYIINSLVVGGAERLVTDILPRLKNKGICIDLLVLQDTESSFEDEIKLSGINILSVNLSNIYSPRAILKIYPYLKDYDAIHVHLFPAQYWVAMASLLIPKKNRPVLFTTEHNTLNRRRNKPLFKIIDRYIYKIYDSIICISNGANESLKQHIGALKSITTIENGVILEPYLNALPKRKIDFGFSNNDVVLTMVASFRDQKDQDTLIRSLKYLPHNYKLLLVGDGDRVSICKKLCESLKLQNRVLFAGIRQDIPNIFKMSDLSIVSSFWEGFGLVAVEGMAAGRPVLGTNVSGLKEVIGDTELLFEVGDEYELAEKIQNLMSNDDLYEAKTKHCIQRAALFSLDKMLDRYLQLYKTVIV